MRTLLLIGSLAFACSASADSAIGWDPARPLTWDDFRGPVPAAAEPERVAATTAALAWSYEYALQISSAGCVFRITRIDSSAEFRPESSWVRPGHRNADVLRHEQGHFDIAQRYKMRFDREAQPLVGRDHDCGARSERRAARNAQTAIEQLVGGLYDDLWRRYRAEQDRYDAETEHGIDATSQAAWTGDLETLKTSAVAD